MVSTTGQSLIGIYFPTYGSGGARRHLTELLSRWVNEPDVHFVVYGPKRLQDVLPISSRIGFYRVEATEKSIVHRFIWELFFSRRVFRHLSVLFVPLGSYIGLKKPFVTMSRNLMLYDKAEIAKIARTVMRWNTHLNRYVQLYTFRNAAKIIFISRYARDLIGAINKSFRKKSKVVHHGIAKGFALRNKQHVDISACSKETPFTLLYVSSFHEYKNHKPLLEAVANIAKEYPVQLLLIGAFPDMAKEKEFLALFGKYNGLANYEMVKYHPELGLMEVMDYYHHSDMFVFPSAVENMPNVLLEAMAAGLPVASADSPPMPEFLDGCGVYFETGNVASIQQAVHGLITDTEARKQYSLKAAQRAQSYSWDTTAERTLKILFETREAK